MTILYLVIGALLGFCTWKAFGAYQNSKNILKKSVEMTSTATGTLSNLVTVRHRNRSFRWVNEYPEITYQADGMEYKTSLNYAEQRRGKYTLGTTYTVRYIPSEPTCCIVEGFEKKLKGSSRGNLIGAILLAFFTFNMLFAALSSLFI